MELSPSPHTEEFQKKKSKSRRNAAQNNAFSYDYLNVITHRIELNVVYLNEYYLSLHLLSNLSQSAT